MILNNLYLRNFRNYEQVEVQFGNGINLIQGLNAQGKTNLLEAIYFVSTGRSFRSPHLTDLIRQGESHFYIEAHFVKEGVEQVVKASFDGQNRKVQYNSTSYSSFYNLLGLLPTVLYIPGDLSFIAAAPAERRRFLDLHIAQVDPLYVHHLARFFKAMKQRNHLLRAKTELAIQPWEETMSTAASYIVKKRTEAIDELTSPIAKWMKALSYDDETLEIRYQPNTHADFNQAYERNRRREMNFGSTLIGPHRDDLHISINGQPAKTFSSEGQKRCAIASLRLAEWQRLHSLLGATPLMSVDDFGTHLDEKRQTILQQQFHSLGQVFLTSPYALETHSPLTKVHRVEKGTIIIS